MGPARRAPPARRSSVATGGRREAGQVRTKHRSALSTVGGRFNRPAPERPKPAPASRPARADCDRSATAPNRTADPALNPLDLHPKLRERANPGRYNGATRPGERRVGKKTVSSGIPRGAPDHKK